VSKVNIATDLELALLDELGLPARVPNAALLALPAADLARGEAAVEAVVTDKIVNFLKSANRA
jgi:fructose-bisphosphate aldolase class II